MLFSAVLHPAGSALGVGAYCIIWALIWFQFSRHHMSRVRRVNIGGDIQDPLDGSVYDLNLALAGMEDAADDAPAVEGSADHSTSAATVELVLCSPIRSSLEQVGSNHVVQDDAVVGSNSRGKHVQFQAEEKKIPAFPLGEDTTTPRPPPPLATAAPAAAAAAAAIDSRSAQSAARHERAKIDRAAPMFETSFAKLIERVRGLRRGSCPGFFIPS